MITDAPIVPVHSVAEAYLFLMVCRCRSCGAGPLKSGEDLTKASSALDRWTLHAACSACGAERSLSFTIQPPPTREEASSNRVNPTADRSRAIDLLGWLTLFQTVLAESHKQADRETARQLAYEAAQCLDEALKFYEPDNEIPGEDAFFTDVSRRRFRDHPQHFSRETWRQRRLVLPDIQARQKPAAPSDQRRWWPFWRRSGGPR